MGKVDRLSDLLAVESGGVVLALALACKWTVACSCNSYGEPLLQL